MKEYKIKIINDELGDEIYLLEPLVPGEKPHYIQFESHDEAHKHKLSLGLGTLADPHKNPSLYRVLGHELEGIKVYKLLLQTPLQEESDALDSCCFSGCSGCPIYAEKMGIILK